MLVKIAPAKRIPATRFRDRPCEETSITTLRTPDRSIEASIPCTSVASGGGGGGGGGLGIIAYRGTHYSPRDCLCGRHESALVLTVGAGEDGMQYVGGRGLAVGTRNAVDVHAPRRIAIDLPGQHRQSIPCVSHNRGRDTRNVALSHNEDGPATDGLGRKLRPVTLEARDRDECEARLYATGIVRHAPHASHAGRDLRPENPSKFCPVEDHGPSVARAITRTSCRFSQENATLRNMPEIPLKQC
jgi:hypothetical protein